MQPTITPTIGQPMAPITHPMEKELPYPSFPKYNMIPNAPTTGEDNYANGAQPTRTGADASYTPQTPSQISAGGTPNSAAMEALRLTRNTPPSMVQQSANQSSPADGHKKNLLQKLMSNLLNKPGRSMHEIINGVKDAVGAYKNYAKEWDNLNGINPTPSAVNAGQPNAGGNSKVQEIMQMVKQKAPTSDGAGGPGIVYPQTANYSPNAPTPIQKMPDLPPTNVVPNNYNQPAPVSSLGVFGY